MGSLDLISKGKNLIEEEIESNLSECDVTDEEYALMLSNPKRFVRKKFPAKNRNWKGSYSSEKAKEEIKSAPKKEEEKKESKLVGDSGYDCNYFMEKTI